MERIFKGGITALLNLLGINASQTIQVKHSAILRGPLQMAFDLTNRCNYRCLHCFNLSGETWLIDEELSDEEIMAFADDVAENLKPHNLCFCGGEPLIRFDILRNALQRLREACSDLSMVTNGSLVTASKAKELASCGLTRAQVSLDGAGPSTHERLRGAPGSFQKAVDAIRSFRDAGLRSVEIAFCPTRFNIHELPQVREICRDIGVERIRVQPLMLLGRALLNSDEILPTPWQYRELIRYIARVIGSREFPTFEWGDPIDHLIRFTTSMTMCYPFMAVKANGAVEVSPYIPLTVGNIKRHPVSQYWAAGYPVVWRLPVVQEMARRIVSIADMNRTSPGVPVVWADRDIEVDLVDGSTPPLSSYPSEVAAGRFGHEHGREANL